ncbi:Peptide transport system ATP-binding protein SapD [Pseudidiomarina piscicola]|uniref:Peptide transport system ATP-binding protein SapD n=1 Tax=Pseudidiomarina piscicola TaxID=2614830 RepID=A0A6S6WMD8_9GAMM|nr:oligopeptide/dipeptide ABC transporter ATP-binding protein [Pseudidiomarina piscicola]CAB0149880.1 Peptide transport system ATP-binding protein SapD [Pseudidiomarina piscicola]VZT39326.1 Peptide transport system ATP-binding protein SapD [Pseudomonas aeruginosa]
MTILDIRNLNIELETDNGPVRVLDRFNLQLAEGEIHTLVGESGSGKSLLAKAILGFINPRWKITADRLWWRDYDLLALNNAQRRLVTGRDMAMIFQDPSSHLDPNDKVGPQLCETIPSGELTGIYLKRRADRQTRAERLLHRVGIKDTKDVMESYPHELSEGLAQKVSIAMAIAHNPKLLIADEPTTAMEPSTRAQIYRLLAKLSAGQGMSILMITQDLTAVVPESQRISLIYCGQLMETGPTDDVMQAPLHPYTDAMLSMSLFNQDTPVKTRLPTLSGAIPTLQHMPIGCRLGPRCPYARRACVKQPELRKQQHQQFACHYPLREDSEHE